MSKLWDWTLDHVELVVMVALVLVIAIIVVVVVATSGPGDTQEACTARGGDWISQTVYVYVQSGKVLVPIPTTTWTCTVPA